MLRGLPHLTVYAPQPVERRKLLPDPENEPDFYEISQLFPLPDDQTNHLEEARAALAKRGIHLTNPTTTVPCPPQTISTASVLAQIAPRAMDVSSLLPLNDLSASTSSAIAAARLSIVDRMPAMDSSINRLTSASLPLYYGLSSVDELPNVGSNAFTLRNSHLQSPTFNPLGQYIPNDTEHERIESTMELNRLLADQQSRDRIATYLQYLNSQSADDISSTTFLSSKQKYP